MPTRLEILAEARDNRIRIARADTARRAAEGKAMRLALKEAARIAIKNAQLSINEASDKDLKVSSEVKNADSPANKDLKVSSGVKSADKMERDLIDLRATLKQNRDAQAIKRSQKLDAHAIKRSQLRDAQAIKRSQQRDAQAIKRSQQRAAVYESRVSSIPSSTIRSIIGPNAIGVYLGNGVTRVFKKPKAVTRRRRHGAVNGSMRSGRGF